MSLSDDYRVKHLHHFGKMASVADTALNPPPPPYMNILIPLKVGSDSRSEQQKARAGVCACACVNAYLRLYRSIKYFHKGLPSIMSLLPFFEYTHNYRKCSAHILNVGLSRCISRHLLVSRKVSSCH